MTTCSLLFRAVDEIAKYFRDEILRLRRESVQPLESFRRTVKVILILSNSTKTIDPNILVYRYYLESAIQHIHNEHNNSIKEKEYANMSQVGNMLILFHEQVLYERDTKM